MTPRVLDMPIGEHAPETDSTQARGSLRTDNMCGPIVLAFLLVLLGVGYPLSAQTASSPTAVGILFKNGALLPFAVFDGRRWTRFWADQNTEIVDSAPASLSQVPGRWLGIMRNVPTEWTVWSNQRPAPFTARVNGIAVFSILGQSTVGLQTDAPRQPVEVTLLKGDEVGVGLSQPLPSAPVTDLSADPKSLMAISTALSPLIRKAEQMALNPIGSSGPRDPLLSSAAAAVASTPKPPPLLVNALYRGPQEPDGQAVYYFKAQRQYRSKSGDAFYALAEGWFEWSAGGAASSISVQCWFSADPDIEWNLRPLHVLRFGPVAYWIVGHDAEDGITYGIMEITQTGARAVPLLEPE